MQKNLDKIQAGWLLPALLLFALPAVAQAQFNFTTNNGAITITKYTGPGGAVTIPSATNGYPVTSIGSNAFYTQFSMTNVTIPDSVTSIGNWAFYSCSGLTSITLPNNITSIGDDAFFYCSGLKSVTFPNGVTNIGTQAFQSCNLTNVTLPNSVITVGVRAFYVCSGLTSVYIGTNVANIGVDAFTGGGSLQSITVDPLNPFYTSVDGVLLNKGQTVLVECPAGKVGSYTIPNSVIAIGDYAFHGCYLTNVTIPGSVTSIDTGAFAFCSLTSAIIPNSVTSIGNNAFVDCMNLTNITIGKGVTNIGGLFMDCNRLTAITVDALNSVYSSADGVLFNKGQSTLIEYPGGKSGGYMIPNSVISIGNDAFYDCLNLTSVMIPNSVTSIGDMAFRGCNSLTNATINSSVTGDFTFFECYKLTSVTIGNSVTSIGEAAFYYCGGLTNVTIPNSVASIGDYAFGQCSSLTAAYFQGNMPSGTNTIFSGAFSAGGKGTAYYLPGTAGWGSTFGGWPTALWYQPNPMILGSGNGLGATTNGFGFTISWATNAPVVVEACTNLANPVWLPLATNTLTSGTNYFNDSQWTNSTARFYRLHSP